MAEGCHHPCYHEAGTHCGSLFIFSPAFGAECFISHSNQHPLKWVSETKHKNSVSGA